MSDKTELERVEELFDLLRGEVPEGCEIPESDVPKLTPEQAWTVIWWLGNQYWAVPDFIERCDICGGIFNSEAEGGFTEDGPPYHFCGACDSDREVNEVKA